jgi:hypothetical protein
MTTMLQKSAVLGLAAAVSFALAGIAAAEVTINPDTGVGFVGKGDVQLVCGWNNAQLQADAGQVQFKFVETVEFDVPCMKENAAQTLRNTFNRETSVNATVAGTTRRNSQLDVTGFNLTGFGLQTTTGNVACPSGWEADGSPVEVGSNGGELQVSCDGGVNFQSFP